MSHTPVPHISEFNPFFKYGGRPFQTIVCEGVEEGLKGMKVKP